MKYTMPSFNVGGYQKQNPVCDYCKVSKNSYVSSVMGHLCMDCYQMLKELKKQEQTVSEFRDLGDTGHPR